MNNYFQVQSHEEPSYLYVELTVLSSKLLPRFLLYIPSPQAPSLLPCFSSTCIYIRKVPPGSGKDLEELNLKDKPHLFILSEISGMV